MSDEDAELRAIREKLRQEILQAKPAPAASGALGHPVDVDDAGFMRFVQENAAVVVDVWAPWCGPCRMIAPIVEDLAKQHAGTVAFAKVNADDNPGVMQAFGIQGIPTLLFFHGGKLVDRVVGAAPRPQLSAQVARLAARVVKH